MLHGPTRTASSVSALAAAMAFASFPPTFAAAQGPDTIIDESNELSDAREQDVQQAFDEAGQEAGRPLYAILTPQTGVEDQQAQQELLIREAREAGAPQDAGVVLVAPDDGWGQTYNFPQYAYDAMLPDFGEGDFAAGLVAGAEEIAGEPVAAQGGPDPVAVTSSPPRGGPSRGISAPEEVSGVVGGSQL